MLCCFQILFFLNLLQQFIGEMEFGVQSCKDLGLWLTSSLWVSPDEIREEDWLSG